MTPAMPMATGFHEATPSALDPAPQPAALQQVPSNAGWTAIVPACGSTHVLSARSVLQTS
jgi:hypothetical protein